MGQAPLKSKQNLSIDCTRLEENEINKILKKTHFDRNTITQSHAKFLVSINFL